MSTTDRPIRYPLTVFYDASCPMCASEMHALKERDRDGRLALVDCSAAEFDENALLGDGLRRRDLMELIHARDACGRWLVGVDAFEVIYRVAGLEAAARVWGSPRLRPLLSRIYKWIARYRQPLSRLRL
jgi:predicted DCC family thiol-disulfide oxidoreductase YuxK